MGVCAAFSHQAPARWPEVHSQQRVGRYTRGTSFPQEQQGTDKPA